MKKVIYSMALLAITVAFTSCSDDDDHNLDNATQSLELRASVLGFSDVNAYKSSVNEQCAAGNHENCDILNDGTHKACAYSEHAGTNHDGTHHEGTDHGTHDANGHSHNSNGHNSGNGQNNQSQVSPTCAQGDHTNCDVLADGTHRLCTNVSNSCANHFNSGNNHNNGGHH